ncbi:NADH-quinone oxidoreductase subunit L, partial [Streptomyces gardneri]
GAGWTVLVAGLLTALLTAAYALRLWLRTFRGRGAEAPDHGRQPIAMTTVLWVLAIPSLGFGLTVTYLDDWFDGHALTPTVTTAVLGTGLAAAGAVITYAVWRTLAARTPVAGSVPLPHVAHPDADAGLVEAEALHLPHPAEDPADPGRALLGPLHAPAADGFHLDAVYRAAFVRPVLAAASLVRFLDREVVDTYVRAAGTSAKGLGWLVRRAQTGNVQTYLSALLAGSVVLVIAAVALANAVAGA